MHSYVSEQDINATFEGLHNPNEIEGFLEFLIETYPNVLSQADEKSKNLGFIQIPKYGIRDDSFYTEPDYITEYLKNG